MRLPKSIERGIQRIEKLDIKEKEFSKNADMILSSSGVGQAPPIYYQTLDKAIKIAEKKAEIWNEIRSLIVSGFKTLWQIALASKTIVVVTHGQEEMLKCYGKDIRNLTKQEETR